MIDFEDPPEEEVEEQGVEVDAADDGSCELGQLAPQLGVLRVPKSMIYHIYNRQTRYICTKIRSIHLCVIMRTKKRPDKGPTSPVTAQQRARLQF